MKNRLWLVGAALPAALVLGSCADNPAGPAETQEIDLHVVKAKCDFFTGGGNVVAGGGKVTFGLHAGRSRDGTVFGHVNVVDHRTDKPTRYQSTAIIRYGRPERGFVNFPTAGVTRIIEGTVRVNGRGSQSFTAYVSDLGEPGRRVDHIFFRAGALVIAGPVVGGDPSTRVLTGGNLQFHDHCIPGNPQSGK